MTLLKDEPYPRELDTMISVRSYYQAASVRLHDSICMRIHSKLFTALRDTLQEELTSGLEIYGEECTSRFEETTEQPTDSYSTHDKCVQLLAEDAQREQRRRGLEDRKAKLLEGERLLNELKEKYDGEEGGPATTPDVDMLDDECV